MLATFQEVGFSSHRPTSSAEGAVVARGANNREVGELWEATTDHPVGARLRQFTQFWEENCQDKWVRDVVRRATA